MTDGGLPFTPKRKGAQVCRLRPWYTLVFWLVDPQVSLVRVHAEDSDRLLDAATAAIQYMQVSAGVNIDMVCLRCMIAVLLPFNNLVITHNMKLLF